MKYLPRLSLFAIALLAIMACQGDQAPYPTARSLDDAKAMAADAGTLILLDLTSEN